MFRILRDAARSIRALVSLTVGVLGLDWTTIEQLLTLTFCGIGTIAALGAIVISAIPLVRPASAPWRSPGKRFSSDACNINDPSDLFHECPQPSDTNLVVEFIRGRSSQTYVVQVDVGIDVDNTSSLYALTNRSRLQSVGNCNENNGLFVAQEIPSNVGSAVRFTSTTKFVNPFNPTPCACLAFCGDRELSSPYGPNFPEAESARDCKGNPLALYGWALMYPAFDTGRNNGSYCTCMNALVPVPFNDPLVNQGKGPNGEPLTPKNSLSVQSGQRGTCNNRAFKAPTGDDFPTGLVVAFSGHYNYSGKGDIRTQYASLFEKSRWCPSEDVSIRQRWSVFDFEQDYWVNFRNDYPSTFDYFRVRMSCSMYPPPSPLPPMPPPVLSPPPPVSSQCITDCINLCIRLQPSSCSFAMPSNPPGCAYEEPGPSGLNIINNDVGYRQLTCIYTKCSAWIPEWSGFLLVDHAPYRDRGFNSAQAQICNKRSFLTSPPPAPAPSAPPFPPFQPFILPSPPSPPPSPPRFPLF